MSEQAKILAEMQEIIMRIIKSGSATPEEGERIDTLEALMLQQKCYSDSADDAYEYLGEEVAALFAKGEIDSGIEKLCQIEIPLEDFFGFIQYHDEDEIYIEVFNQAFIEKVQARYKALCS